MVLSLSCSHNVQDFCELSLCIFLTAFAARCITFFTFEPASLIEAVQLTAGRAKLEASGGVRLSSVREIAETGVDYISSSQLTMSAETFDIGLDIAVS